MIVKQSYKMQTEDEKEYNLNRYLYKAVIKPIWAYGIQLGGTASSFNKEKL